MSLVPRPERARSSQSVHGGMMGNLAGECAAGLISRNFCQQAVVAVKEELPH